jgi:hypothetical protein
MNFLTWLFKQQHVSQPREGQSAACRAGALAFATGARLAKIGDYFRNLCKVSGYEASYL